MNLIRATVHEVLVPTCRERILSEEIDELRFDDVSICLLELETDDGLIGLGEARRGTDFAVLDSAIRHLFEAPLESFPIAELPFFEEGRDNRSRNFFRNSLDHQAVIGALLDLMGKRAGLPVCALLGGAVRDCIAVDAWQSRMTSSDSARSAVLAQADGFSGLKIKCALGDDLPARLAAIREACGLEFSVTVDPNGRLGDFETSGEMLREAAAVGNIGAIEDPFPKTNLDEWAKLRAADLFPMAIHAGYSTFLREALVRGICDYANLGILPYEVLKASALCHAFGVSTWHGSGVGLGVSEALHLQVAAACPSMNRSSDLYGRTIREHNLIDQALRPVEGKIGVPHGPGLGVSLDRDAIEKYLVDRSVAVLPLC